MPDARFLIWSDIHEEFEELALPEGGPGEIDAVLVAGDTLTEGRAVGALERVAAWAGVPVIATAGNHDYYGSSIAQTDERCVREAEASAYDIRFLNPGVTTVAGCRIIAATLWTDYRLRCPSGPNQAERRACEKVMNDHKKIRWGYDDFRLVTAEDLAAVHLRHKTYVLEELAKPHEGPTLVMTHHAPSENSVKFNDERTLLDHAYASNLEEIILTYAPDVWIHGHTHNQEDYRIGYTRVVANPRGYPRQESGFEQMGVYEVSPRGAAIEGTKSFGER